MFSTVFVDEKIVSQTLEMVSHNPLEAILLILLRGALAAACSTPRRAAGVGASKGGQRWRAAGSEGEGGSGVMQPRPSFDR